MSEPQISERDREAAREFLDGLAWHTCESEARGDTLAETATARRSFVARALAAARAEEREACAKVAESPYGDEVAASGDAEPREVGRLIAAAIRGRSDG